MLGKLRSNIWRLSQGSYVNPGCGLDRGRPNDRLAFRRRHQNFPVKIPFSSSGGVVYWLLAFEFTLPPLRLFLAMVVRHFSMKVYAQY